jgi:hypothetical protein
VKRGSTQRIMLLLLHAASKVQRGGSARQAKREVSHERRRRTRVAMKRQHCVRELPYRGCENSDTRLLPRPATLVPSQLKKTAIAPSSTPAYTKSPRALLSHEARPVGQQPPPPRSTMWSKIVRLYEKSRQSLAARETADLRVRGLEVSLSVLRVEA